MMKLKKILFLVIDWIWCFPQTLLGLIVLKATSAFNRQGRRIYQMKNGVTIYQFIFAKSNFGVSLGRYIILSYRYSPKSEFYIDMKHECGHSKQSRILGWLYLPLVGLPSAILNILARFNKNIAYKYYTYYPECWADILGGVDRDNS